MTVIELLAAPRNGFFLFRAKQPDGTEHTLCRDSFAYAPEEMIRQYPDILAWEVTEQFEPYPPSPAQIASA